MLSARLRVKPLSAYAVSHPSAPPEPTNKGAIPCLRYAAQTGDHSLSQGKSAWRIFGVPLSEAALISSQNCFLMVLGGLPLQPQVCRKPISPRTPIMCSPLHVENHLVWVLCISNSFLSLVSSCRSLVRVSALSVIFPASHLVNRKPIDKTT